MHLTRDCSQGFGFFNTPCLPLQSCNTFISGGACFKQCFSTPFPAKASSPRALGPCHSSGSAGDPDPDLGFPLKTSREQLLPGQTPRGEGRRGPRAPRGRGCAPPAPGPLGSQSNSSPPFSANYSCDHTTRAGHSG